MSELKHKLPVAPLSDARWRTIEQGLFEQLDREPVSMPAVLSPHDVRPRRSRRTMATLTFAATAAAAALLLLGVVIRDVGRGDPTARIATDEAASRLAFGDADIRVAPHSVVLLRGDADSGVLAIIERGEARFWVAPRENRPPFAVSAGEVRVEVVGTIFSVARDADLASVQVTEGKVRVRHGSENAMVTAGETWSPRLAANDELPGDADIDDAPDSSDDRTSGEKAVAQPDERGDDSSDDDGDHGDGEAFGEATDGAGPAIDLDDAQRDEDSDWTVVAPANGEARDPVVSDGGRAGATRRQRARQRARRAEQARRERARAAREREKARQQRRKPEVELPPPVRSQPDPASERYLRAAELEASSPRRALELYKQLAGEKNEWSELSLFAWARLELERGNKGKARRLLRRYLSSYPRGRNRADAKALLDGN